MNSQLPQSFQAAGRTHLSGKSEVSANNQTLKIYRNVTLLHVLYQTYLGRRIVNFLLDGVDYP